MRLPDGTNETALLSSETTHVVDTYLLGATYNDETAAEVTGGPPGPVLMMRLTTLHKGHRDTMDLLWPLPTAEKASTLREALLEVTQACRDAHDDPSVFAAATAAAHARNAAAGFLPGTTRPRCPGCGCQLFMEVAARGGCLGCYPDVGPLEAAADLTPGSGAQE